MNASDKQRLNLLGLPQGTGAGSLGDGTRGVGTLVEDAITAAVLTPTANIATNTTAIALLNSAPAAVAALDIDWSTANVFTKTTSGNTTFTFSNTVDGKTITVVVTAGGAHTAAFPTAKWVGGAQPTQTSSGIDVYSFVKVGSTIYASVVQGMA